MKEVKKIIRWIVRSYVRLTDENFLVFAQKVIMLTSISKFLPDPTPTMVELQKGIDDYSAKLTAARNRDAIMVGLKNSSRAALTAMLDDLKNYVTLTAAGDIDALLSSGMDINKMGGSISIDTPQIKLVNGPNPGELVSTAKNASAAKSIEHEITEDPVTENSVWQKITTTVKSYTFSGLDKGKNYWARVTAIGGKNQRKVSAPASRIVQ